MTVRSRYLFIAGMDIASAKEAEFNQLYNTEHIPLLQTVPGVGAASRLVVEDLAKLGGGRASFLPAPDQPKYWAFYEIRDPDVLLSDAWAVATNSGRWPQEIRPFARNRQHTLMRVIFPE